jgi:uncharacterized coiled-coil DUF342 family protein
MLAEAATACLSAYTALKETVDESNLKQEDFKKLLKRCNRFEIFVANYDTTSNDTRLIERFRDLKSCFQRIQKRCEDFTFKKTENPQRKKLIAARNMIQGVIFETSQLAHRGYYCEKLQELRDELNDCLVAIAFEHAVFEDFKNDTEALQVTDFRVFECFSMFNLGYYSSSCPKS